MPTQVPIEIFNIGRTQVDREEVGRWMKFIGADEFELPQGESVTNPAALIALAAKRCYMSFEVNKALNPNITRIRKDYNVYFDNILKSGHGSVLEHSVFNFAIENVSRVFTAEMNRHRAGWAISEGSLRFIRFGENVPYWVPDSIKGTDICENFLPDHPTNLIETLRQDAVLPDFKTDAKAELQEDLFQHLDEGQQLEARKELTRHVFEGAFTDQELYYRVMEVIWDMDEADKNFSYKKKVTSMMRRIIGLGVATGGVWSGNVRALRHVITMRTSPAAEEEILHVFSRVAKKMQESEPMLFGDFEQTSEGYWVPKYVKV